MIKAGLRGRPAVQADAGRCRDPAQAVNPAGQGLVDQGPVRLWAGPEQGVVLAAEKGRLGAVQPIPGGMTGSGWARGACTDTCAIWRALRGLDQIALGNHPPRLERRKRALLIKEYMREAAKPGFEEFCRQFDPEVAAGAGNPGRARAGTTGITAAG